jgi:hypothetical protein
VIGWSAGCDSDVGFAVEPRAAEPGDDRSAANTLRTDSILQLGTAATIKLGPAGNVNLYWDDATSVGTDYCIAVGAKLEHWGTQAGFFATPSISKATVTGSRAS